MGEATTATSQSPPLKLTLTPSESLTLATSLGFPTVSSALPTIVNLGRRLALAPISSFPVCAAALLPDNTLLLGVNLEFPSLPLHHSVHAEQFLLSSLSLLPSPLPPLSIFVSALPCGHCRQFLQELRSSSNLLISVSPDFTPRPLPHLLPHPFGPHDLLPPNTPLLLEPHHNSLFFDSPIDDPLVNSALDSANSAHAPYSGCPSGVAVVDCDGRIYKGSYVESAAYNPSMQPAQAAIIAFVAAAEEGMCGYERIVAAALVEKEGAVVRQEETVRMFFAAVNPNCVFRVFRCHESIDQEMKRLKNKIDVNVDPERSIESLR